MKAGRGKICVSWLSGGHTRLYSDNPLTARWGDCELLLHSLQTGVQYRDIHYRHSHTGPISSIQKHQKYKHRIGAGKNKKKDKERKEWNYETGRNKDRHAVRGGERKTALDRFAATERQKKTNTAPFCLPHQTALFSKCQGSWISGLPVPLSQACLPSRFELLSSNLDCQVFPAARACTAGFSGQHLRRRGYGSGGDRFLGGGTDVWEVGYRWVTERQTDWHLEKYTVGTKQRLCSHDYDLSPQVVYALSRQTNLCSHHRTSLRGGSK